MIHNSEMYRGAEYASFRPKYPEELFRWLCSLSSSKLHAWDCGTGNGQVARGLAPYFDRVTASDSNPDQIDKCFPVRNVRYVVEPAEKPSLAPQTIDLVTAACAVHWFHQEEFYDQVRRVLKPDGVIAFWCYEYPWTGNNRVDDILRHYKDDVLGAFWPPESQIYFNRYETLKFPFRSIQTPIPTFEIDCPWDPSDVLNFLATWTGPINYQRQTGQDPRVHVQNELFEAWAAEGLGAGVKLPIYMKVGRL